MMKPTAPSHRGNDETNLPTEQSAAKAHPRVSRPHGHARRTSRPEASAGEGAKAPLRVDSDQAAQPAPRLTDQRFPKANRLRRRGEFLRLQRVGKTRGRGNLVVIVEGRPGHESRLGITASRKVGPAVVRNRVKRRVREFFRTHREQLASPQDILVIVRAGAATATYAQISSELAAALRLEGDRD